MCTHILQKKTERQYISSSVDVENKKIAIAFERLKAAFINFKL